MGKLPLKNVVKAQIENPEEVFNKNIKIVYNWIQDQVDTLAMRSVAQFKNFIDSIPNVIDDDDETKNVILSEKYIFKNDDFDVKYHYTVSSLIVTIKTTIPLNVERAFKICQLIDRKKIEETLKDFELIIYTRGKELVDTTISFTRSSYGYMSERTFFVLSENPADVLALN